MKFGKLYRDVVSRLNLLGYKENNIFSDDVVVALNDAIRQVRTEYVTQGYGTQFSVTEDLYVAIEDLSYPFLRAYQLQAYPMQGIPIYNTIVSANAYVIHKAIQDTTQSFLKNDFAYKGNKYYKAVESFENINTYNKTFSKDHARNYQRNNGLTYKVGQIIYDHQTGSFYKVNETFTANIDLPTESITQLEKVYWMEKGSLYIPVFYFEFDKIQNMRLFYETDMDVAGYTINKDFVYVTPNINRFSLTYVPEWEDVTELDSTITLPDFIIPAIKQKALVVLGAKLGINLEQPVNEG